MQKLTERQKVYRDYARQGMTQAEIAAQMGTSTCAVRSAARRAGFSVTKERDMDYRDKAAQMKRNGEDPTEYLLGVIELLKPVLKPCQHPLYSEGLPLSGNQFRMMSVLYDRMPNAVSKSAIMDVLYADKVGDHPEEKIIQVMASYIRVKLMGTNWRLVTVRGFGYKLERR